MEDAQRKYIGVILSVSILFNIVFAGAFIYLMRQQRDLQKNFNEMATSFVVLEDELNISSIEKQYYQKQAEYYIGLLGKGNASGGFVGKSSVEIVAVRSVKYGISRVHEGVVLTATVETEPGEGRILVSTDPRIGIDIQTSMRTAIEVVENLTGINLGKTDIILTIEADEENEIVDGSSAGGCITIVLLAALTGEELNEGVYLTGSIQSDGTIGSVAGIAEKAEAAAEKGASLFLVPLGQAVTTIRLKRERTLMPGFTITTYESKNIGLEEYLNEMGYRMKVREVETFEEAYRYFIR